MNSLLLEKAPLKYLVEYFYKFQLSIDVHIYTYLYVYRDIDMGKDIHMYIDREDRDRKQRERERGGRGRDWGRYRDRYRIGLVSPGLWLIHQHFMQSQNSANILWEKAVMYLKVLVFIFLFQSPKTTKIFAGFSFPQQDSLPHIFMAPRPFIGNSPNLQCSLFLKNNWTYKSGL